MTISRHCKTTWLRESTSASASSCSVIWALRKPVHLLSPSRYPRNRATFSLLSGIRSRWIRKPIASIPELEQRKPKACLIDWYSRFVLAWQLSNTLDSAFCLDALDQALEHGKPEIFNTDQGAQFTAHAFTGALKAADIRISMDGRGRAFDSIFVERLWRTVKYEDIYIRDYPSVPALTHGLEAYFRFYNHERYHQSLDYAVPAAVHFAVKEPELGAS